jgi:surface polysaccharide O-acyltransferase-like enzyme
MVALILVVIIVCVTRTAAWGPLYAMAFIVLFLSAPRWQWVDKGLMLLGNHSMNMWLIHAWFCYYIFHDLTYSLGYPLLIYIALIVISLLCSYLVNAICSLPLFIIEKCQNKK